MTRFLFDAALDLRAALRPAGDDLVLVASDARLQRAAKAEGLEVLNPQTQFEAEVDALLSTAQRHGSPGKLA